MSAPIRLGQAHLAEIARSGIPVPTYDRARLQPRIVHVGVGGFHRAHLAVYAHELASRGSGGASSGLGLLAADAVMAEALGGQDCLYTLIEKDGRRALGAGHRVDHALRARARRSRRRRSELIAAPGDARSSR